jgi:hypothetical protein
MANKHETTQDPGGDWFWDATVSQAPNGPPPEQAAELEAAIREILTDDPDGVLPTDLRGI